MQISSRGSWERRGYALFIAVLFVIAFWHMTGVVSQLQAPTGFDTYRDIGMTHLILDGRFGDDYAYEGERNWYPPGLHLVMAAIHFLLPDWTVKDLWIRLGPLVNLPAALLSIWLVWRHSPGLAAAAATVFLVFVNAVTDSCQVEATYAIWLSTVSFAVAPFIVSLVAIERQEAGHGFVRSLLAGIALGVTFLCHLGPALILGGVLIWNLLSPLRDTTATRTQRAGSLAIIMTTALVTAFPQVQTVIGHYRLQIVNPPDMWVYLPLRLESITWFGWSQVSAYLGLALFGAWSIRRSKNPARRMMYRAGWVSIFFLLIDYLRQALIPYGIPIPAILPSYHFFFYCKLFQALFAGLGVAFLMRHIFAGLRFGLPRLSVGWRTPARFVVLAWMLAMTVPLWHWRFDVNESVEQAKMRMATPMYQVAYPYLREHTAARSVCLASYDSGLINVICSGRQVVATYDIYTSSFIDPEQPQQQQAELLAAMAEGDWTRFQATAEASGLDYIIDTADDPMTIAPAIGRRLVPVLVADGITIYRVSLEY